MRRQLKGLFLATFVTLLLVYLCFTVYYGNRTEDLWGRNLPRVLRHNTTIPPEVNPIPSLQVLEKMSPAELQLFYHSYVNSPQVLCNKVVRMGKLTDGGWELCDDPIYKPPSEDCLVYSFGINHDFSYDDDMARYGCEIHAFDPSMQMSSYLRGDRIYFHAYGVGGKNETVTNSKGVWPLYTIASFRKMYKHTAAQRRLDVVKMDVERAELESLNTALDDGSLEDVRQLSFETHVTFRATDPTKSQYLEFLALLRKVYDKGFRIYITHRNFIWSSFQSQLNPSKKFASCHEIHTVNINIKNDPSKTDTEIDASARVARENVKKQRKQIQDAIIKQEAQTRRI